MFIENELKVLNNTQLDYDLREDFLEILRAIINEIISDKQAFSIEDFNLQYFDEFTLKTNCHENIYNTVYIEINQPSNFKPQKIISKVSKKPKLSFPELYYSLEEFKDDLFTMLVSNLDSNNIMWKDNYSVCLKTTINIEDKPYDYYFRIIPCITYFNENNVRGQMYKKNEGIEIEYITSARKNFEKKNKQTKDVFRQTILIFKNILLREKNIKDLPREILETMCYNVPNEMFKDTKQGTLINMINYIRNNSIKEFKTLDEQDLAFVSQYKSMSLIYVKHATKLIEKQLVK